VVGHGNEVVELTKIRDEIAATDPGMTSRSRWRFCGASQAFPQDGAVSAKTVELRDRRR
jgi:hypothetical protein